MLRGTASVLAAGEKNAVAVAGWVNGMGSLGCVLQEQMMGWIVWGNVQESMRITNLLALSESVFMVVLLAVIAWHGTAGLLGSTLGLRAELICNPSRRLRRCALP